MNRVLLGLTMVFWKAALKCEVKETIMGMAEVVHERLVAVFEGVCEIRDYWISTTDDRSEECVQVLQIHGV